MNTDPELPEAIALRCEPCRLANIILDDIRDEKYNNAEQFNTAYMLQRLRMPSSPRASQ